MNEKTDIKEADFKDFLNDSCSEATRRSVEQWIAEEGGRPEATPLFQGVWDSIPAYDTRNSKTAFRKFAQRVKPHSESPFRKIVKWSGRVAALLFIPLLIAVAVISTARQETVWTEKLVANGQTEEITLPDGTTAKLNAGTHIIYPEKFDKKSRRVFISGEALLDVAKDEKRPFTVSAGGLNIKVLGTRFNVKSYVGDERTRISLLEGKVVLSETDAESAPELIMLPGDMVIYEKSSRTITKETFDPADYASWWDGGLVFRNETLAEITAQLGRIFDVNIVIKDEKLLNKRYYAAFKDNESLQEILDALDVELVSAIEIQ